MQSFAELWIKEAQYGAFDENKHRTPLRQFTADMAIEFVCKTNKRGY